MRERITALPGLTLEQAAAITDFGADVEAVDRLTRAVGEGPVRFTHVHRDLVDARQRAEVVAAATARWAAAGYQAFDRWPSDRARPVRELLDPHGHPLVGDTPDGLAPRHAECPGRAVVLSWSDPGDDSKVVEWCTDPRTNGHRPQGPAGRPPESLDRAEVVANNRAWTTATSVRQDHIAAVIRSGRMPADLVRAMNLHLLAHHDLRTFGEVFQAMTDFTASGIRPGAVGPIIEPGIPTNRAAAALLAATAAAAEETLGNGRWRHPSTTAVDWLKLLVNHTSYQLSDIELIAVRKLEPGYQPTTLAATKTARPKRTPTPAKTPNPTPTGTVAGRTAAAKASGTSPR